MILGMTYYNILLYFLVYSLAGWVLEVAYHAVVVGKVINRGFLNGPVCPVYGFGAVGIFFLMHAVSPENTMDMNPFLLYIMGVCVATLIELIAGVMLEALFHARWWDYSSKPFNFHGYICLEFSLLWGVAILIVIRVMHPMIQDFSKTFIPEKYGWWLMAFFYILYASDLLVSVLTVIGLNKRLKELDEVRARMRIVSDNMSQEIAVNTIRTTQKVQEGKVQAALARAEMRESLQDEKKALQLRAEQEREALQLRAEQRRESLQLRAEQEREALRLRAEQLSSEISHRHSRLMRAFPQIRHKEYGDVLEEIKKRLQ